MFCKWCGMESTATDLCSWCHRPLSATATESAATAAETPMEGAPEALPLVASEEEEAEEESPLAAGITADRSAHRPAPAHRPAWAPVPRAGAPASTAPSVPPEKAAEAVPSAPAAPRPTIGVRRPGGAPGAAPANNGAAIGVRRPGGAPAPGPAPMPSGTGATSRPPAPGLNRPVPPQRPASGSGTSVSAHTRPAATGAVASPSADASARPTGAAESNGARASTQTATPVSRAGVAARPAPTPLVEEVEETGGLADGIAAAKRPIERTSGVPAMGTFTPTNSKYYTGQVVDPASGNHYDSATGKTTSTPSRSRPEDVVLVWDDPASTPRHISRFALAFVGLLVAMAVLIHLLPAYAAVPLIACLFAAGLLLPVMRAVPFQSDDSEDLVWFVLLTLIFGPGIGLLIYSIKAFLLRDMNLAVLGLLIVSFASYLVFQLSAPLAPTTPNLSEGFFNVMKLAPPWTQVGRYGFAALLYNWTGIVAMVGWFVGNVFKKLDE
jgi:hypothetical protein